MGWPTEFSIHPLKGLLLNKNRTRHSTTLNQGQALECENGAQAGMQGQWPPSISSLRCPKWTRGGAPTIARSCIFITSCCTLARMVPMAALGEGGGKRCQGLPGSCRVCGSRTLRATPQEIGNHPQPMSPCLYLTFRLMSQHNLEGPEYRRKEALKSDEHTHLRGGKVEAQSRGKQAFRVISLPLGWEEVSDNKSIY